MTDKKEEISERKYPTGELLKSRELSGYQQDFTKAVLNEPEYTVGRAKQILDSFFQDEKGER